MPLSRSLLAVFLCLLSLHLGLSMELVPVSWLGVGLCLLGATRLVPVERPTAGLLFVLFTSGAFLGNQVLEDWALEGSWPQDNGLGAGFLLSLLFYLLWLFAARPATAAGRGPIDRDQQQILVWGLLLLLLLTPPDSSVMTWWEVRLAPLPLVGLLVAVMVLVTHRCSGALRMRLALLLPLVLLVPMSLWLLDRAQGPVIAALGDLIPRSRNFTPTGFSPNQQLRASIFLRPSNRAVMRIQAESPPGKYLVGNRLSRLSEELVWVAEERPLEALIPFSAEVTDTGELRYPITNHLAPADSPGPVTMDIFSLTSDNYLFLPPDTHAVTGRFESLLRNAADVWTGELERGAVRRWSLQAGGEATPAARTGTHLQLPALWDENLQRASASLSGATAEQTVANVLAHFQNRAYVLETSFDPQRPLHDFFLSDKGGYCFWFATATTLALRANGIPSRLVGGYVIHEQLTEDLWLVRERDAHSWVEWQDSGGYWHTIDPTPATLFGFFDGYRSPAASVWYHRLAGEWRQLLDRLLENPMTASLIAWGGLSILAFLFLREYHRIRRANLTGAGAEHWQRLWRRFLAATSLPEHNDWTASTYAGNLPADWSEARRHAVLQFLADYNRYRFSSDPDAGNRLELALRKIGRANRR